MSRVTQQVTATGYGSLLRNGGFQAFLWTQFLGAFNDNVYKMIVSVGAIELAGNRLLGARYLALAGAIFVLPFLLFAGYAGQIADRFSKTRVLQITKAFEIVIMCAGMAALYERSINMLLVVLFLLAMQANLFSPAKYGILPEMLSDAQISRANGLLEFTTFAAIILGTSGGTFLFARWKNEPLVMGGILLAIAIAGSFVSIFISRVPPSGSHTKFRLNPVQEIVEGIAAIKRNRPLGLTVAGISWFWFIGALFQLTVILLGSESLHLSERYTGLLVTALAFGIGAGSIAAGWLSGDRIEIGLVPCGAAVLGICSIGTGMSHTFFHVALWLAASGFAGGLFVVPLNAWLQEAAAPEEKGRLLLTNNFLNAVAILLASGVLWLLHDAIHCSAREILVIIGLSTLLATIVISWIVPSSVVRFVIWSVSKIFFRVRVIGVENIPAAGGALLVANHVSYADAVLIGGLTSRPVRFVMWKTMYERPWFKPICCLFDTIPLVQASAREAIRPLRQARTAIEGGELVAIFPEGQLTRTSHVQPFERGAELILRGAETVPVIPIYLDGLWGHALSLKGGRAFASPWRFRHPVTIRIGGPLPSGASAHQMRQSILELGAESEDGASLSHEFIKTARRNWSAPALADSTGRQLSYGRVLTASFLLSRWIRSRSGDSNHIGLLFPSCVPGAIANLGVTLSGRVAVNLNFTAGEEHLRYAVERCGMTTILSLRQFVEKAKIPELPGIIFFEDLLSGFSPARTFVAMAASRLLPSRCLATPVDPGDPAAVIFSSGSTGKPKGVVLSHRNVTANTAAAAEVYSVNSKDCLLGALPFFHSFGYSYTLWFPLLNGFKAVFHANPLDAARIGELASTHRPTLFLSTPTFCLSYLRKCTREQFASIRNLLVGAEKLQPKLAAAFQEKFGIALMEGYGCTEMGPAVSVNVASSDPERSANEPGSVGRPLPRVAVKIVDPDTMKPLAEGDTGLIVVNGPGRMMGYLGDPERTAAALYDGYYVTGDLGYLDAQGFLHIIDRLARFSKIGGEMISHLKIEESLSEILGTGRCVVTGIPDESRGERLSVVYTSESVTPGQMVHALQSAGLPPLWIPKRDQFHKVDAIPVLGSGKVDLMAVRALARKRTECAEVLR